MLSWFTKLIHNIQSFIPGGPNRKYIITFMIVFVWMALFDKNRWITQWQLQRTIYKYEKEKSRLNNDIVNTKEQNKDVVRDVEKFGREKYLMTKNDEDLFIIAVE